MRKLLCFAFLFLSAFAFGQTVTVSGHTITGQNGTSSSGISILWELTNDNGQQCKVAGTGLLTPMSFSVTQAQLAAGIAMFPNSGITCGTTLGASRWRYTIKANGVGTRQCSLNITGTTNLDSTACLNATSTPVTVTPTDSLYCRIDGTNCGFTGPITGTSATYTGNVSVGGTLGAKCVNGVCDAANSSGADWCAKATNAISALSGSSGKVTINQAAGTTVCAAVLNVPSNVILEFSQTGTWITSCAGVVVNSATHAAIIGNPGAGLKLPNSCADGSRPLHVNSSTDVVVRGLDIDGNGNTQAVGGQSADIVVIDSNQVKILNNVLHDAQGDDINVNTTVAFSTGCNDILIEGNTFTNIGRQMVTLTGFGCNDFRVLGNHFSWGTAITTSNSRGNPIHLELDSAGSGNRITIADNDMSGVVGTCISTNMPTGATFLNLSIKDNQCTGTNSTGGAGIIVFQAQDFTISGNHITFTGATSASGGMNIAEAPGIAAQVHRNIVSDNTVEGVTGPGIILTGSESSGTPQSFNIHDNTINSVTGVGIWIDSGAFTDVDVHDNILTNLQAAGIQLQSPARFHVHHNTIRDFGLNGSATSGIVSTCDGSFTGIGPGEIETNRVGSSTTTGKTGIGEFCAGATNIYVYNNDVTNNTTPIANGAGYTNGFPPGIEGNAPTGVAGSDFIWPDSTAHRWKMINNNGTAQSVAGFLDNLGVFATGGTITPALYASLTNCSSSGGTCVAAPAGRVSIAAAATTVTVATTAVTANSEIILTRDNSLGTALSVTCNTQSSLVLGTPYVSARTAATSFVVTIDVAPTTNPLCISYEVKN